MKIHTLEITKDNINAAERNDSIACPVAKALWDYFGDRYIKIEVLAFKVYLYKKNGRHYATFIPTLDLRNYILDWDTGRRIVPKKFKLGQELIDEEIE